MLLLMMTLKMMTRGEGRSRPCKTGGGGMVF